MLLDPETWDLVQHIDSVLAAVEDGEHEDRIHAELMQSVLEVTTPGLPHRRRRHAPARTAARVRRRDRARRGLPLRLGRHAPVQPLRAPADHGARPLPAARRPAAVHRAPRADLRHAHARRRRRSGEGDPGDERAARAPAAAARAVGVVAVLARRADRALVEPADGVRGVPALRPAAALQGLRRLRGGRRPARAHRLHRRLHAHLVGHPPAPAPRHDRDARLRRGDAARGRRRDHGVLPGDREDVLRAVRGGPRDPDAGTACSRPRTSGSPRATGSRRRSWTSRPAGGTASRSRS